MERKESLKTKPILLHYYITNRCNSRCTFCTIWQEKPKVDAQLKDLKINLQHAWNAGCTFVDFTGGEPLLHKDLPEFLRIAKKIGFITSVTTNCILFNERAAELANLIDLLHFSLDADNELLHNKLHGVPSYDCVVKSIEIARKNNLVPDLLFTYSNDNIDFFKGVSELARNNRIILILDPVFSLDGREQISINTHHKAISYSRMRGVYLNKAHLEFRLKGANRTINPQCKAVETTIVILPDNKLALPCYHHRTHMLPIKNNLNLLFNDKIWKNALANQGAFAFCEGCHINCYFDPSYSKMRNKLNFLSNKSKLLYTLDKYIFYRNPFPMGILKAFLKQKFNFKPKLSDLLT